MDERYEKIRLIGRGATAEVYLVRDGLLMRYVAVKCSKKKDLLLREARAMAKLAFPCIPALYGYEEAEGTGYLAMEYVEGETLEKRAGRIGFYTVEEVLRIACLTAEALAMFHEAQSPALYGDIKPENIIMTPEGSIRLIDLGTVLFLDGSKEGAYGEKIRGATPAYAAPEFWQGKVDARSDIYALGRLMEKLLSTAPDGRTAPGVTRLIERCVNPQPKYRFASAREFLAEAGRVRF